MVVDPEHWRKDCPLKGNTPGHVFPGVLFLAMGIWWTVKYSYRLINKNSERGSQNLATFCQRTRFQRRGGVCLTFEAEFFEGLVLVVCSIMGIVGEQSYPYMKWRMFNSTDATNRVFVHAPERQHCTIYAFIGIFGFVLILSRTVMMGLRRYEMFFAALSLFVEGMIFYFHIQGRVVTTEGDHVTHIMIVITALIASGFTLAEVWMPSDNLLQFVRSGATIVQGTWFIQIGYMLSGQTFDTCAPWEDTMSNFMFVTMAFFWHIAASIIIIAVIFGTVSLCQRKVMKRNRTVQLWGMDDKMKAMDEESTVKLLYDEP